MRYLNTVYVNDHKARIARSKDSLIVSIDGAKHRVPLEGIDGVTIVGGASMTLDAVASCVERDVRVAVLKRSGALRWYAGAPVSGNVSLRRAQHRASDDPTDRIELCRVFVAAKLRNSSVVLSRWARDSDGLLAEHLRTRLDRIDDRIGRLRDAPTEDHVRGIEGDAARDHFACVGAVLERTGWHFTERSRRPPRDPVNALLGFAYGLLVTELIGGLESVGLDPQIGFLHRDRPGRPALALDLAEEFRPLIDRFVVGALRRGQFGSDDFEMTPGDACYLSDSGRRTFFRLWEDHKNTPFAHRVVDRHVDRWALPAVQATLLARHLRGDLSVYAPFILTT